MANTTAFEKYRTHLQGRIQKLDTKLASAEGRRANMLTTRKQLLQQKIAEIDALIAEES